MWHLLNLILASPLPVLSRLELPPEGCVCQRAATPSPLTRSAPVLRSRCSSSSFRAIYRQTSLPPSLLPFLARPFTYYLLSTVSVPFPSRAQPPARSPSDDISIKKTRLVDSADAAASTRKSASPSGGSKRFLRSEDGFRGEELY